MALHEQSAVLIASMRSGLDALEGLDEHVDPQGDWRLSAEALATLDGHLAEEGRSSQFTSVLEIESERKKSRALLEENATLAAELDALRAERDGALAFAGKMEAERVAAMVRCRLASLSPALAYTPCRTLSRMLRPIPTHRPASVKSAI